MFVAVLLSACSRDVHETERTRPEYVIVIHGGAGVMDRSRITQEREELYRSKLNEALETGEEALKNGDNAISVVTKVINVLEDSPLFNAGKGAVFTHDGYNELDASIMDGKTLNAGSVAGVRDIRNPINAAKLVMTNSEHVMLSGPGASRFARENGIELVDSSYFFTVERWRALQRTINDEETGTVGCVVLDKDGNLAAGTSTGGMTNKKYGRIGDSPIIGAGTYANNATCAVSATGHGEYFIRYTVAHDISTLMEYRGMSLSEAADFVILQKLKEAGGSGGIIAVDKMGNISMSFNSQGMFRGFLKSTGERGVYIFREE
ncbi:MAG: isoaspartyl peptidase/L-asparaginase [Bacteroidales bacterium]|nr:MAG: isoaspartyl peptidase/L-asparaginase [Bacteroidales bacterium]